MAPKPQVPAPTVEDVDDDVPEWREQPSFDPDTSEDELLLHSDQESVNVASMLQMDAVLTLESAFDVAFSMLAPHTAFATKSSPHGEPRSFAEAMCTPEADQWYKAAETEIQGLMENGTWELVNLPHDKKAISSRWVFRLKRNADGSIERYKGRIVAQGFSQRPGIDYVETFAPTPRWATIRAVFALVALEDLDALTIDFEKAFSNAELDEEVSMRQPEGFVGSEHRSCFNSMDVSRTFICSIYDYVHLIRMNPQIN